MEEKKFVQFKKEEFAVREYIKNSLGKGKISKVVIEYTPIGEKIRVFTNRPGIIIGRGGERIDELTRVLKKRFHMQNPYIEINEIKEPMLDAQLVADDIAMFLERRGSLKFKVIAYRALESIKKAGARGAEIALSGKLPSDRARTWKFRFGYLKKTGDLAAQVSKGSAQAQTISGVVGVKVSILRPDVKFEDQIEITDEVLEKIKRESLESGSGGKDGSAESEGN
ncbi:30S ribosomal protein S3 [Candidatus Pacearchaeota archaeon]|nr:MAG: 30S ribosomal protein S3 [Candidatus Pacearchaeota archaeon]